MAIPTPAEAKADALAVMSNGDAEAALVAARALLILDAVAPLTVAERAQVDARLAASVFSPMQKALRALAVSAV